MSTLLTSISAYYKLNEASGNAADSVGSNTLTNFNTTTFTAGKLNNGADGGTTNTNKYLRGTNIFTDAETTSSWSVSFWVRFTTLPIAAAQADFGATVVQVGAGKKKVQFSYLGGTGAGTGVCLFNVGSSIVRYDTNFNLSAGIWYNIVYTYDGTTGKIYVDAVERFSGSVSFTNRADTVEVGFSFWLANGSGGEFTSGILDEIGVWKKTLTGTEVSQLYFNGTGRTHPFSMPSFRYDNNRAIS